MRSLELDEELRNAAISGDVEFLRKCVESNKPTHYYLTFFPFPQIIEDDHVRRYDRYGNIFHIAAYNNRLDFISEAIQMLPSEDTQQLLIQPVGELMLNPLHMAAYTGNVAIVKLFLDVYKSLPALPCTSKRPWLLKASNGYDPCNMAVTCCNEECAMEIIKMDMELISNMLNNRGSDILYEAVLVKLTKLALEILRSPYSVGLTGYAGRTPFHVIHFLKYTEDAKEIFRLLLQRDPGLIKLKTIYGKSAFHEWAREGKLWPFKFLLESHDIIPNVKRIFADLVAAASNPHGTMPLHLLAEITTSEEDAIEIAKLHIEIYNEDAFSIEEDKLPWLVPDNNGDTPLFLAIRRQFQKLAMYILSVDDNAIIKSPKNVLFLAVKKRCHEIAEKILEIVDKNGWTQLLSEHQQNILHLAPLCKKNLVTRLIRQHPEFLERVDKEGFTILHKWIVNGKLWLFKYILESEWRSSFVKFIDIKEYIGHNLPFHVAATSSHKERVPVVKLLIEAYKDAYPYWARNPIDACPWAVKNKKNEGPVHLAIRHKNEDLALYLLSLHQTNHIDELLDYYEPAHSTLFLAIQNNCFQVAQNILAKLDKNSRAKYLVDSSSKQSILHLAPHFADEKFGTWLINEASEFISKPDNNEQRPLDEASYVGNAWFIEAIMKKDPSALEKAPLAWVKACEKGYVPSLRAFIDCNPGKFRDICINCKDSPLHHIKLTSLTEYEQFLRIPRMKKDLINLQNPDGSTPLHKAVESGNILLTETLLNMDKILRFSIKDKNKKTATDLLAQVCKEDYHWVDMCKRIGFDPYIKTSYFQRKTNLLDVRNSLFVVAALLATITFTAGFTLPGGLNQSSGEAILARKAAFLIFLISNTLAMCSSMLVLIFLVWSMVQNNSMSLLLIDKSMIILMVAFYSTLLAFTAGVYIVIYSKVFWAAIIVVIMCSLVGISSYTYRTLLRRYPMHQLEMGIPNEEQETLLSHIEERITQGAEPAGQTSEVSKEEDLDDEGESDEDEQEEEEK